MLPIIYGLARAYAPYIVFPFAVVIGAIGYNVEWKIRDKNNPNGGSRISVLKERDERLLKQLEETPREDLTKVDSLKAKTFVAKSIFEKNLSPTLQSSEV